MASRFWELIVVWGIMLLVSVANGACRDFSYGRFMVELAAHQLLTVTAIIVWGWSCSLIFSCIRRIHPSRPLVLAFSG